MLVRTAAQPYGSGRNVRIDVEDNGGWIQKEILARVFDPFFTTKDPDQGTELGLAISKSIVEGFGGTIEIQSEAGHGTTVTILLPEVTI